MKMYPELHMFYPIYLFCLIDLSYVVSKVGGTLMLSFWGLGNLFLKKVSGESMRHEGREPPHFISENICPPPPPCPRLLFLFGAAWLSLLTVLLMYMSSAGVVRPALHDDGMGDACALRWWWGMCY